MKIARSPSTLFPLCRWKENSSALQVGFGGVPSFKPVSSLHLLNSFSRRWQSTMPGFDSEVPCSGVLRPITSCICAMPGGLAKCVIKRLYAVESVQTVPYFFCISKSHTSRTFNAEQYAWKAWEFGDSAARYRTARTAQAGVNF